MTANLPTLRSPRCMKARSQTPGDTARDSASPLLLAELQAALAETALHEKDASLAALRAELDSEREQYRALCRARADG